MVKQQASQADLTIDQHNGSRVVKFEGKLLPTYEMNGKVYFLDSIPVEFFERDEEAQPREYDEVAAAKIAESVARKVLMQPILARYDPEKRVFLVTEGQHRWRAMKDILVQERVPAIVYLDLDKHLALLCGLEANAEDRAKSLSGGDIARKTQAIMEEYATLLAKEEPDTLPTEETILARLGKTTRATQRKFILGKLAEDLRETKTSRISHFVSSRQTRRQPITAKNFMLFLGYIARPGAVNLPWESPENLRGDEFKNLLHITDILAEDLFEEGKWDPDDPSKPTHVHAVRICKYHPFQGLAYAIAKSLDRHGGGDATVGAAYAQAASIDWEKVDAEVRGLLRNSIWDLDYVHNMRSQEDLREFLAKEKII